VVADKKAQVSHRANVPGPRRRLARYDVGVCPESVVPVSFPPPAPPPPPMIEPLPCGLRVVGAAELLGTVTLVFVLLPPLEQADNARARAAAAMKRRWSVFMCSLCPQSAEPNLEEHDKTANPYSQLLSAEKRSPSTMRFATPVCGQLFGVDRNTRRSR
jgi:hypothetical protein